MTIQTRDGKKGKVKKGPFIQVTQNPPRVEGKPQPANKLMAKTPEELSLSLEKDRLALKALQDFDAGTLENADEAGTLVLRALGKPVDVTDFVEREQTLALLARNIRMKETALRIHNIQRNKTFNQKATQVLFDRREKKPVGSWTSLFGKPQGK